jgi:hypothetical protein
MTRRIARPAHDIFGALPDSDLSNADNDDNVRMLAAAIAEALGVPLEGHYSDYLNGVYYDHESEAAGSIRILNNVTDDDPEDAVYTDFPAYAVLVEVRGHPAQDELRERLVGLGLTHLRHTPAS